MGLILLNRAPRHTVVNHTSRYPISMPHLFLITQAIFCLVSMTLTAMFALSLSGISAEALADTTWSGQALFLAVLFVLIGCCIDIGKYVFWAQRQRSRYYGLLSLILMVFSLIASCAFFMSSESGLLQNARLKSSEYAVLQQRMENYKQEIAYNESLLEKRLNSAYHKQWEAGQGNAEKLSELRESLVTLMERSSQVGWNAATKQVAVSRFFTEIGQTLNISVETLRITGYSVLSLLLEISALGMISLRSPFGASQSAEVTVAGSAGTGAGSFIQNTDQLDLQAQQAVIRLICDILSGRAEPVFRKLRLAKYGLELSIVQQVLKNLHSVGVLKDDKRNSYKLALATKER